MTSCEIAWRTGERGREARRGGGGDFGDEVRYDNSTTVPPADQEICRRVEARVASVASKDAGSGIANHGSVTNGDSVPLDMTAIKSSGTPGAPRQLNVLSNFKYEYFVAGISGGVVSTLMLHPLDLIKIRFAGERERVSHARRFVHARGRTRENGGLSHCGNTW